MCAELRRVLERAQVLGMLGPGPVEHHVEHARTLGTLVGAPPTRFLDLGSGAGVPGLVLACEWREATGVLLDASERKCRFLTESAARLGLGARVEVVCGRAEGLARRPDLRGSFDLVVARGFGRPAVTAECAVGFLRPGGRLAVSEPPVSDGSGARGRWPLTGLSKLGFDGIEIRHRDHVTVAVTTLARPADERWPRRDGVPAKRPLWA
jgi:16S rRNA (guanine527-N7)-methyltransferase